jgi:hypothetical protein
MQEAAMLTNTITTNTTAGNKWPQPEAGKRGFFGPEAGIRRYGPEAGARRYRPEAASRRNAPEAGIRPGAPQAGKFRPAPQAGARVRGG